ESEKTPKYRKLHEKENLNLVCPAKCHPLQLETPERARCTPLGVDLKAWLQSETGTFAITLKESEKTANKENRKGKLNLVCPAKCHPLQLETPERARFTPLGHGYKSETEHFCDNFKGIRENCEIKKTRKWKPKSVCPAKCHPLQLETPERARLRP
ncbi:hypothetical protein Fcan01_28663, partial [Folsomia candida]